MQCPRPDELLAVVHIARPHGVTGEVSALDLMPPVVEAAALLMGTGGTGEGDAAGLYLRSKRGKVRSVRAVSVRPHQGRWLIRLEGIETRTAAEPLREADLCLRRRDLPELPEGWYWEADLESCRVIDRRLGEIGEAAGLDAAAIQPQLRIRRPDGRIVPIPWVRALVTRIEIDTKRIWTDLPAGFPGLSPEADQD